MCVGTEHSGLYIFIYFQNYKIFNVSILKVHTEYFEINYENVSDLIEKFP